MCSGEHILFSLFCRIVLLTEAEGLDELTITIDVLVVDFVFIFFLSIDTFHFLITLAPSSMVTVPLAPPISPVTVTLVTPFVIVILSQEPPCPAPIP